MKVCNLFIEGQHSIHRREIERFRPCWRLCHNRRLKIFFELRVFRTRKFLKTLTLSVVPGSKHCCLLISTWIPSPLSHMTLNEFFPGRTFSGVKDSIVITVETSKDDTGIDGSETSEGISKAEIVKTVSVGPDSDKNST